MLLFADDVDTDTCRMPLMPLRFISLRHFDMPRALIRRLFRYARYRYASLSYFSLRYMA